MHLVHDENGDCSHAHGQVHNHAHDPEHTHTCEGSKGHDHCHGCQEHQHVHPHEAESGTPNETVALLNYMLQHNEHHAAELSQMAARLRTMDMAEAADHIETGVSDFQKGNMRLSVALALVKEQLQ